jgi:hypothetical protein
MKYSRISRPRVLPCIGVEGFPVLDPVKGDEADWEEHLPPISDLEPLVESCSNSRFR